MMRFVYPAVLTGLFLASSAAGLSGCQTGTQYYLKDAFPFETVCIVDNRSVPASFFLDLRTALEDKGLTVKTVQKTLASKDMCPAYINYSAKYKTKAAQKYLAWARLSIVENGDPDVVAVEMNKTLDAPDSLLDPMSDQTPMIRSLVNRLLPRATPW